MRAYLEFVHKTFANNMVYRFDYIMGIFNTCLQFFIFWCIYKSLYGNAAQISGITLSMVMTNFIISLGLSNAFQINDMFIQRKVQDGTIANELLRPVNLKLRILFEDIGNIAFRLLFNFLPAFIISALFIDIKIPSSFISIILFTFSVILGFLVLWQISFIIQTFSFWIVNIWSISTIKNVLINVFSGTLLPIWFMPDYVLKIIKYTPFQSIYFTPIKFYLGQIGNKEILWNFGLQIIWILILYFIGDSLWKLGQKRLIVNGG